VEQDPVLAALEDVRRALTINVRVGNEVIDRIDRLLAQHDADASWVTAVPAEGHPLIVELLAQNLDRLSTVSSRLRRAQAKALHDEGMTMEQIASYFGVTRQRISALLKERPTTTG